MYWASRPSVLTSLQAKRLFLVALRERKARVALLDADALRVHDFGAASERKTNVTRLRIRTEP